MEVLITGLNWGKAGGQHKFMDDPVLSFSRLDGKLFREVFLNVHANVITLLRCILCLGDHCELRDKGKNQKGKITIHTVTSQNQGRKGEKGESDNDAIDALRMKAPRVMIFENKFVKDLFRQNRFNAKTVLCMFGQVVKGIFKAMLKVRERMKTKFSELAPYQKRYELAGQYLTKLLHAGIQRGEEMTAIATCLSAGEHVCIDHKDLNNCSMAAYSHHGMLCLSVRDSRGLI